MAVTPCTHGIRPPEFPELPWINVEEPLRLKELEGKVVMVGFWSSSCVRCQEGLPAMAAAMARFNNQALQIIAVHGPRFDGEHDLNYVRSAVGRLDVPFAVVVDNAHRISRMFNVRELPTIALIDPLGYVCRVMRGVPDLPQIIEALESLLGAAGAPPERSSAHRPSSKSPTSLRYPGGVSSDGQHIVIADSGHHRLVVCDRQGNVLRCPGGPQPGFTDAPSEETRFFRPHGLALYEGQVLVADTGNHAIRCVDLTTGHSDTLALIPSSLEGALRAPWSVSR